MDKLWISDPRKIQFSSLSHYHMLFWLDVNGTKIGNGPSRNRINQFHFPKDEKDGRRRIKKGWKRGTDSRFESFWILSNSLEFKTNRKSNNRIFRFYSIFSRVAKIDHFRVEIFNLSDLENLGIEFNHKIPVRCTVWTTRDETSNEKFTWIHRNSVHLKFHLLQFTLYLILCLYHTKRHYLLLLWIDNGKPWNPIKIPLKP